LVQNFSVFAVLSRTNYFSREFAEAALHHHIQSQQLFRHGVYVRCDPGLFSFYWKRGIAQVAFVWALFPQAGYSCDARVE
jgi:hypothetical protein